MSDDYQNVHIESHMLKPWEEEQTFNDILYEWMSRAPWLLISLAAHLLVFFILAGASLDLDVLWTVGGVGVAYVVLRIMSRMLGGWLGATLVAAPRCERIWYGPALLPQAGVAVGVALVAADHMPDSAAEIMALTIGATVVFELIGPIVAAIAIRRATGD